MVSPIHDAFNRIIQEIYWIEDLDEAEDTLAKYLEQIDPDLRAVLLDERKKICNNPEIVLELIRIDALADSVGEKSIRELLLLQSLVDMLFLVQCSPKWARLGPREKARILAPLYKAFYGMRLAAKRYPNIDEIHLSVAFTMAEEAYERADRMGLVDDVYGLINRFSEELLEEFRGEAE